MQLLPESIFQERRQMPPDWKYAAVCSVFPTFERLHLPMRLKEHHPTDLEAESTYIPLNNLQPHQLETFCAAVLRATHTFDIWACRNVRTPPGLCSIYVDTWYDVWDHDATYSDTELEQLAVRSSVALACGKLLCLSEATGICLADAARLKVPLDEISMIGIYYAFEEGYENPDDLLAQRRKRPILVHCSLFAAQNALHGVSSGVKIARLHLKGDCFPLDIDNPKHRDWFAVWRVENWIYQVPSDHDGSSEELAMERHWWMTLEFREFARINKAGAYVTNTHGPKRLVIDTVFVQEVEWVNESVYDR